jgi:UrcA family protein
MNTTIRTKLYTAIGCVLGTTALCALSVSAQAADPDVPTKTVRFTDLNIQTPEGAKVLYNRIRVAAREVCEISVGSDPILIGATRGCIDTAIDNAVKKVNAPYLTALRFGTGTAVRVASK